MISWFKSSSRIILPGNAGNALPIVLFFATFGLIAVVSYLSFHLAFARPSLHGPSSLQALFNARSGIYKAFEELTDSTSSTDPLKTINTLSKEFGGSMFGIDTAAAIKPEKLTLDGGTKTYELYTDTTIGECEVTLIPEGGSCILRSIGSFNNSKHQVEALLGSSIPAHPDTVLIYYNPYAWNGKEPRGTKVARSNSAADSVSPWLKKLIDKYKTDLAPPESLMLDPPLTIQSNKDLRKIPRKINGDLIIDGSFVPIIWKDTGTFTVIGDVNFNLDVNVEGIKIIASGQIVLSGKAALKQVSLFSLSKIHMADNSVFQGNAMALKTIAIYGNSTVKDKSTIIVPGTESQSSLQDPSKKSNSSAGKIYGIEIGDRAFVDGILISLGNPGDIKTYDGVKIKGIMIAQNSVAHLGKMAGLICAGRLIDPDDPSTQQAMLPVQTAGSSAAPPTAGIVQKNVLPGELEPLANITEYKLPFFFGKLSIIGWKED